MKKITFLMCLLITSLGFSQVTTLQDFEVAGTIDGGFGAGVTTALLPDPATGGTNGTVAQIIAGAGGDIWQGANVTLDQSVDLTQTLPADRTMQIDVYSTSPTPISMLVRVIGPVNNEASAVVTHPGGSVWATLTATFDTSWEGKPVADGVYTGFVVFPNWDTTTANFINPAIARTVYFDNISGSTDTCSNGVMDGTETGIDCGGSCTPCPSPPTVDAPTPPARLAADVVSIYSGAYANPSPINYDAGWCGAASVTEFTPVSDPAFAYNGQACQGINFDASLQDVTGFTFIHVDLFIEVGTDLVGKVFNMKIVPTTGAETAFNVDINALSPAPVPGTWYSYDQAITLSGPTTGIKEFGVTSNLNNVLWYDNMYFHKNTTLSTEQFAVNEFSVYPNPTNNNWNIKGTKEINSVQVYDILGKQVISLNPNANELTISSTSLNSGLYFAKINSNSGTSTIKLVKE